MNSRVGPLPFHKCCSVLRCALKVFVLFCMVLLYLYLRIFFWRTFLQTNFSSIKTQTPCLPLIHLRKYEIPAQGWALNSLDGCNQRVIAAITFFQAARAFQDHFCRTIPAFDRAVEQTHHLPLRSLVFEIWYFQYRQIRSPREEKRQVLYCCSSHRKMSEASQKPVHEPNRILKSI